MRYLIALVALVLLVAEASAADSMSRTGTSVAPALSDFTPTNRVLSSGVNYVEIEVDCYHGGWCTCCDRIDYACNGTGTGFPMPEFCPFADPVPSGKKVIKIESHVWGDACNSTGADASRFDVLINGQSTGVGTIRGTCMCGECNEGIGAATPYSYGLPGYIYGGENRVTFDRIDDGICVDRVVLRIYFRDRRAREAAMPEGTP